MPSSAIAFTDGRTISFSIRVSNAGVTTSAGEYVPIPPVFGPVSPSPTRLWSCDVGRIT